MGAAGVLKRFADSYSPLAGPTVAFPRLPGPTSHPPFSPVKPWRLPPRRQRSPTLAAVAALHHLEQREAELRRTNRLRFFGGCGVLLAVAGASLLAVAWWTSAARRLPPRPAWAVADPSLPVPWTRRPAAELSRDVLSLDGVLAVLMLPIAVLTRQTSRADVANQILDHGCRGGGGSDPFTRIVLAVMAVGLLWGEFLILDAAKSAWVAVRLRGVDRHRAALVLAMVRADPTGIDPRLLLRAGERPIQLRRLIAYLVVNEWADVTRHGDRLTLVSPARRALRH